MLAEAEPPAGFEVVLLPPEPFDPIDRPEQTLQSLDVLNQSGATVVNVRTVTRSLGHYLEQLHALSELFWRGTDTSDAITDGTEHV
jgi:hypothetical protein